MSHELFDVNQCQSVIDCVAFVFVIAVPSRAAGRRAIGALRPPVLCVLFLVFFWFLVFGCWFSGFSLSVVGLHGVGLGLDRLSLDS
jgi:hypothetical protein